MFSLIPSLRVQALCHRCGMSALRYWPLNKFPQVWIHIVHLQDPALFCFSKNLLSFLPFLVFICKKLILLGCYNKTCCHLHKFTALCAVSHLLVGYKFPLPTPIAGTTSSNFEYEYEYGVLLDPVFEAYCTVHRCLTAQEENGENDLDKKWEAKFANRCKRSR